MIRFVDIRGQGTGYRFSFWDTVTDQYICINGEQAWDDWEDFEHFVGGLLDLGRYKKPTSFIGEVD